MSMKSIVSAAICLFSIGAFAQDTEEGAPRTIGLEQAIETKSTQFVLPGALPGMVSLRPCDTCAYVTLQITTSSTFFLSRSAVTFDTLRQFMQGPTADVVVLFDPKSNAVTRIIATDRPA